MTDRLNKKLRLNKEYKEYKVQNTSLNAKDTILYDSQEIYDNTFVKNLNAFEKPDMYAEFDDKVIGIEVFEFSSYKNYRKGDSARYLTKIVDADNLKERRNTGKNYFSTHISTNSSLKNYEDNFEKIFNKHYKEVNNYKNNLSDKSKKVEIYFLIKDTTVDGNVIIYNNKPILFNPTMSNKVLNIVKNSSDVSGFIFQCSTVFNQNVFFYLKNSKENIEKLYNENKKYFGIELEKNDYTRINSFYSFEEEINE